MIYFDNNATTQIDETVRTNMAPFLDAQYGNPNSIHQLGTTCRAAIEKARASVAKHLGVMSSEIIFTGTGSEANNHAIIGTLLNFLGEGGNVVISPIEHSAVSKTAAWACEKFGFELRVAPFKTLNGGVDPQPFLDLIDNETRLISVMTANNETGVILPIKTIFDAGHQVGAICHSDGVQGLGKIPLSPKEVGADIMSFTSHKFHGPKGAGAMFLRRGVKLESLIHGGGQENARRAGTENVANIVGFSSALDVAMDKGTDEVRQLRDYFEAELCQRFGTDIVVNFAEIARTPNVSNVRFKGQDANLLVIKLDRKGFCVSTGSACSSGSLSASSGLMAAGLSEAHAKASIRFSFSKYNTREEVDQLLAVIPDIIKKKASSRR